jgi:hypothetical protein
VLSQHQQNVLGIDCRIRMTAVIEHLKRLAETIASVASRVV